MNVFYTVHIQAFDHGGLTCVFLWDDEAFEAARLLARQRVVKARAVTFGLDIIQLNGEETPTLIRNLRATLVPDICPDIQFWKKAKPQKESYGKYEHAVEAFIFDMKDIDFLSEYEGTKPFFLCSTFTEKDAESIRNIRHPQLAGIDLSTSFESQPGIKDIERLKAFLDLLKN